MLQKMLFPYLHNPIAFSL